jgi:hypothetical protein
MGGRLVSKAAWLYLYYLSCVFIGSHTLKRVCEHYVGRTTTGAALALRKVIE